MRTVILLLFLAVTRQPAIHKVDHALVVYKYARDIYGSYAPYSKPLYLNNKKIDFFESTDELEAASMLYCRNKGTAKLDALIAANYQQRGIANSAKLSSFYTRKSTDTGSTEYTLHTNFIYNKLNEDTLYVAFGFDGSILQLDGPGCENFTIGKTHCMTPAKKLEFPMAFLYQLDKIYEAPIPFLQSLHLKRSVKNSIKVSYCD